MRIVSRCRKSDNNEYGIRIDDPSSVACIRSNILDYSSLGAPVSLERLLDYCKIAEKVRDSFRDQVSRIAKAAQSEFQRSLRVAEDELIKLRLADGPMHTVFSRAVLFFLKRNGPLATTQIHKLIEHAYPDLCDNAVDRVIDGERYGKRWKHAVRTAQQHLKGRGLVEYLGGRWQLIAE
jgi:hypothetical protein